MYICQKNINIVQRIDYAEGKGILDIDVIKKIGMNKYRITNPNNNILRDCKSRMTEKLYIIIIFIVVFASCKKEPKWERSLNDTGCDINELRKKVLYEGDTNAFWSLFVEYLDEDDGRTALLPYSIIMSNKTNDYFASYVVFSNISLIYCDEKLDSIDEATAKLAIEYLEKSAKTGYEPAINDLDKLPKNSNNMTYKEKFIYINSKR